MSSPWEQVQEEYACNHADSVLTVKAATNGVKIFRRQCLRCGQGMEVVKHGSLTGHQKAAAVPFDEDLRKRWWEARSARYEAVRDANYEAEREERRRVYNAYLHTPEWRAKRAQVISRARGMCEGCLKRPANEVHHLTYERVGREMLFDLVAICEACHRSIHPIESEDAG